MRILFCSQNPLLLTLGAPKVLIELGDAMREIGWDVSYLQPSDLGVGTTANDAPQYRQALRQFLVEHSGEYDVIDYDHGYLPYPRTEFSDRPLMVARSALLIHQIYTAKLPQRPGVISAAKRVARRWIDRHDRSRWLASATDTMRSADLINVSNRHDAALLQKLGIPPRKIAVIPLGLSAARRSLFDAASAEVPSKPVIGFVGTYDYRKGALDIPNIFQAIVEARPDARLLLLGTAGLHQTAEEVLDFFPKSLRPSIDVVPRFAPDDLPKLLSSVSVGIFPSYLENFGFGVLEMLAAAVPVVAYDVPGPPMMLPPKWLVGAGDVRSMAQKVLKLLNSYNYLVSARHEAKRASEPFTWHQVARQTDVRYRQ